MQRHTFISDGYYAISGKENFDDQDENYFGEAIDKLAYYENLEEERKLIILPCKVGDKVWVAFNCDVMEARVQGISVSATGNDTILHFGGYPVVNAWGSEVGKTIFLSREEALEHIKQDF